MDFFNTKDDDGNTRTLIDLAAFCVNRIQWAERDGVEIDDGNVVDLIADNSNASLADIRMALIVAALASRFPKATSGEYVIEDFDCDRSLETEE